MRILFQLLILSISIFSTLNSYAAAFSWQKVSFITQSFHEVALGSEYGKGDYRISKWVKPINIFVQHDIGDSHLQNQLVDAHIQHLSSITQLTIKRVSTIAQANLKFFFTDQKNLLPLITKHSGSAVAKVNTTKTCIANISLNQKAQVRSAQIYIPVDFAYRKGKLVACIVEELTQILGLPRDSEKVYPSIFNDKSTDDLLTGLDETLIRILYSPKIKAGMTKNSLSKVLVSVINQLNHSGLISTANRRVKQTKLYAMLGY